MVGLLTGKKHAPIPVADWHNVRYTRKDGTVSSDFEMSIADAVNTSLFYNRGIVNLAKVEWRGAHIGPQWRDVTETYKMLYQEGLTRE
jgi:hypothetical protein